jgi:hypothetical protein|tara:strand:+ start:4424 stop:5167 length:744 start_codon:yes stop_codon:yes gene_type:complete
MDTQSMDYGQENFTLPHDVVQLPSQGIFYKNKKKSIKVGYLTASDENILMGGANDLTMTLLRAKIYEPDIKVEELLEGDVEAILIFLRNTGFGPEITLNVTDPVTKKPFKSNVLLDQLNIINGQQPNEDGSFTTLLPKSQSTIKLKPLSYGEIIEIGKLAETYPQGRVVPKVTWRMQKEIIEVDGSTDKASIAKFVESMPISDSKFIRKFMNENEPRLDMTKTIIAPSGEKLTVNVGFGVDFFLPFF